MTFKWKVWKPEQFFRHIESEHMKNIMYIKLFIHLQASRNLSLPWKGEGVLLTNSTNCFAALRILSLAAWKTMENIFHSFINLFFIHVPCESTTYILYKAKKICVFPVTQRTLMFCSDPRSFYCLWGQNAIIWKLSLAQTYCFMICKANKSPKGHWSLTWVQWTLLLKVRLLSKSESMTVKFMKSVRTANNHDVSIQDTRMHSVCCCCIPIWRGSPLEKGPLIDPFLRRLGSTSGRICPKSL